MTIPLGTHPGKILRDDFLNALDIDPAALAANIGVPVQTILDVAACRRSVDAALSIRLSAALGTRPDIWLRLQVDHDVFVALEQVGDKYQHIPRLVPLPPPVPPPWQPGEPSAG